MREEDEEDGDVVDDMILCCPIKEYVKIVLLCSSKRNPTQPNTTHGPQSSVAYILHGVIWHGLPAAALPEHNGEVSGLGRSSAGACMGGQARKRKREQPVRWNAFLSHSSSISSPQPSTLYLHQPK